jgi:uncharacterized protein (DUF58 family)
MVVGNDDFYGFRDYRRGDSPRQVHWKGLAKGQGLQTKQYTAYADRSVWLDWEMFPGLGVEQRSVALVLLGTGVRRAQRGVWIALAGTWR